MADFSSSVISGNTGDAAQLILELETKLPTRRHATSSTTGVDSNSTTAVELLSLSVNGVETDEVLNIIGISDYGGTVAGDTARFDIFIGGVSQIWNQSRVPFAGGNTSNSAVVQLSAENLSGNLTVQLMLRRAAGSGTITAARKSLSVLRTRKRSS